MNRAPNVIGVDLGGTSLLIVVNVTVDTISQIQSHLLAHQYGDLIKKAKLKVDRFHEHKFKNPPSKPQTQSDEQERD